MTSHGLKVAISIPIKKDKNTMTQQCFNGQCCLETHSSRERKDGTIREIIMGSCEDTHGHVVDLYMLSLIRPKSEPKSEDSNTPNKPKPIHFAFARNDGNDEQRVFLGSISITAKPKKLEKAQAIQRLMQEGKITEEEAAEMVQELANAGMIKILTGNPVLDTPRRTMKALANLLRSVRPDDYFAADNQLGLSASIDLVVITDGTKYDAYKPHGAADHRKADGSVEYSRELPKEMSLLEVATAIAEKVDCEKFLHCSPHVDDLGIKVKYPNYLDNQGIWVDESVEGMTGRAKGG
jgi:hypothetical protein